MVVKTKKKHQYTTQIKWTGNKGLGTSNYKAFERSHTIWCENKIEILGSSDPAFLGDKTKYNPEELLVAALSSCHMLWYLHLCAQEKIIVTHYEDYATGIMHENIDGSGKFDQVTLNPIIIVKENLMIAEAVNLHKKAHKMCFIANSTNFPIHHNIKCTSGKDE